MLACGTCGFFCHDFFDCLTNCRQKARVCLPLNRFMQHATVSRFAFIVLSQEYENLTSIKLIHLCITENILLK